MAKGKYLLHSIRVGSDYDFKNVIFVNDEWIENARLVSRLTYTLVTNPNAAIEVINSHIASMHGDLDWFIMPIYSSTSIINSDTDIEWMKAIFPNFTLIEHSISRSVSEDGVQLSDYYNGDNTYQLYTGCYSSRSGIGVAYRSGLSTTSGGYCPTPYYAYMEKETTNTARHYRVFIPVFSENIIVDGKYDLINKNIQMLYLIIVLSYYDSAYHVSSYINFRNYSTTSERYYVPGTSYLEGREATPVSTPTDISDAQVIIESDYFFTGNPIIPTSVNVYLDGTQLERDVDYTVGVTNNTYVGQANVNIAGIGNYTGTKQAHFTIARAHIDTANISVDGTSFPYTGQEIEPTVTITMGGYTAQRSVDYVLRYSDNVNIGTGSIQIDTGPAIELGTGNFQGTATATFQITGNDSPYEPGGTTEPEIGPTDGDWDLINNPLNLSYTNHNDLSLGLFRAYAMDKTQLSNFGKTLWRPSILQSITALLSNPLDTIISLGSFPFTIDATPSSETIEFNWIDDWIPDGWQFAPTGHPLNGEYQTFSFGTVTIPRYSGTFYDFQPYTQAQIYIPYIGYVNVKANEIIGKQIELQYHVNLITGDFTAIVFLSNRLAPQIIGEYQGNMLRELPLSMSTFVNFVGTAIKTTAIAGAAVAAFGAAAPLAATAGESAKNLFEDSLIQSDMGNYSHASILRNQSNQIEKTASNIVKRDARRAGIAIGASAIGLITNANQPIPRNGTIGAVSGRTSTQEAFVSLSLPHQNIPSNQAMLGYPTNLPGPLSKFSGYTIVRDIHVKSSTALYSELIEIEKVVRGGIVI